MFGKILCFNTGAEQPEDKDQMILGRSLRAPHTPRLGVVLSAGGARGLAHVGVLQVLEEQGIEIAALAGTSMGSYVGALWAAGLTGAQMEDHARAVGDHHLWRWADPLFPPMKGLFYGRKLRNHLASVLGTKQFADLPIPLFVIACDIETRERVIFSDGPVVDSVHASCAVPGIIAPVNVNGRFCVDGAVVDPVPVSVLRSVSNVERVLAVSVIPTLDDVDAGRCRRPDPDLSEFSSRMLDYINQRINFLARGNAFDTFRQSLRAAQIRLAHHECQRADLCIRPGNAFGSSLAFAGYRGAIDAGRKAAEEQLPAIRALLATDLHPDDLQNKQRMVG